MGFMNFWTEYSLQLIFVYAFKAKSRKSDKAKKAKTAKNVQK